MTSDCLRCPMFKMSDSVGDKENSNANNSFSSSSTTQESISDARMKCGLCKNSYNDPRLLPCLHTYCLSCLQKLETHIIFYRDDGSSDSSSLSSVISNLGNKAAAILCPACGTEVELPKGGPEQFPCDFMVKRMLVLDSLNPDSNSLVCDLCTDNAKAVSRCVECMVNVCEFCAQAHKRQRKTAGHDVISMDEAQRQGMGKLHCPVLCLKHTQEELKLFCETCDRPVCRECCLVEHREHLVEYTEEVAEHHARVIANLVSRLQPHMQAIVAGKAASEHLECLIKERGEQVKVEVELYFDNFIQSLQAHRQALLSQVGQVCESRVKTLRSQRAQLQQILTDMEHGGRVASQALADSNNKELMSVKHLISQRLCHLNRITYQSTPKGDAILQFKPKVTTKIMNGIPVPGIVDTKVADPVKSFVKGDGIRRSNLGQETTVTVVLQDTMEQPYQNGADEITAELAAQEGRTRPFQCKVQGDGQDGSYRLSYTPKQLGPHSLHVFVNGQHIRGSPFDVMVKVGWQEHTGVWHCCTFCSSEGSKQATCACGGIMPGGFRGCGHSHPGHPGKWHWSCCAVMDNEGECRAPRPVPQNLRAEIRSRLSSTSSGSSSKSSKSSRSGSDKPPAGDRRGPLKFSDNPATIDKRVQGQHPMMKFTENPANLDRGVAGQLNYNQNSSTSDGRRGASQGPQDFNQNVNTLDRRMQGSLNLNQNAATQDRRGSGQGPLKFSENASTLDRRVPASQVQTVSL